MAATDKPEQVIEPVEVLNNLLEQLWQNLCYMYDAASNLPDTKTLFEGAPIKNPTMAARRVMANMLLETMENIGRFSPWYTCPARAFGLVSMRDPVTGRTTWTLAPEGLQKWQPQLDRLTDAIDASYSVLSAIILVDNLMESEPCECEPLLVIHCTCNPPRSIRVTRTELEKAEILCDTCMQPFR